MSLAVSFLPLALGVARTYRGQDRSGIESAALLGLVRAEADFNPERGAFGPLAVTACRRACLREVERQRRAARREESLFFVGMDGEEVERRDLPHAPAPDGAGLMVGRLREVLAELAPREREVLVRRFGLEGPEESLAAVGDALGLSRARVAQIERRSLGRLRRALLRRRVGGSSAPYLSAISR
jgi:RNA polymerase sigma factor (sigma-70 family)